MSTLSDQNLIANMDVEQQENMQEEATIDFDSLLAIASGADEDGVPNSAIAIGLVTLDEAGEIESDMSGTFGAAVSRFTAYGNVMVVESDFPQESAFELHRVTQIIQNWVPNMKNIAYRSEHILSFVVTPVNLDGGLVISMTELMYASLHRTNNGMWRLITVFAISEEDGSIAFLAGQYSNNEEIRRSVDVELTRQNTEIDREYAATQEELQKLAEESVFDEYVEEQFGTARFDNDEDDDDDDEDDFDEYEEDDDYDDDNDPFSDDDDDEDEDMRNTKGDSWFRISKD